MKDRYKIISGWNRWHKCRPLVVYTTVAGLFWAGTTNDAEIDGMFVGRRRVVNVVTNDLSIYHPQEQLPFLLIQTRSYSSLRLSLYLLSAFRPRHASTRRRRRSADGAACGAERMSPCPAGMIRLKHRCKNVFKNLWSQGRCKTHATLRELVGDWYSNWSAGRITNRSQKTVIVNKATK